MYESGAELHPRHNDVMVTFICEALKYSPKHFEKVYLMNKAEKFVDNLKPSKNVFNLQMGRYQTSKPCLLLGCLSNPEPPLGWETGANCPSASHYRPPSIHTSPTSSAAMHCTSFSNSRTLSFARPLAFSSFNTGLLQYVIK